MEEALINQRWRGLVQYFNQKVDDIICILVGTLFGLETLQKLGVALPAGFRSNCNLFRPIFLILINIEK